MKKNKYVHTEHQHNTKAATETVPQIISLLGTKSVIDVGCGTGTWLYVFDKLGVTDFLGIEGDHLDRSLLEVPAEKILIADLEKPIQLKRQFDLCICLEVAEHLQEKNADTFIQSLVNLSDTIIFSAAFTNQGGQNHLNEQWPQYWQKKFAKHGYDMYDVFRDKLWNNEKVQYWYKQNMFLYTNKKFNNGMVPDQIIHNYIHPELFIEKTDLLYKLQFGKGSLTDYAKLFVKYFLVKLRLKTFR